MLTNITCYYVCLTLSQAGVTNIDMCTIRTNIRMTSVGCSASAHPSYVLILLIYVLINKQFSNGWNRKRHSLHYCCCYCWLFSLPIFHFLPSILSCIVVYLFRYFSVFFIFHCVPLLFVLRLCYAYSHSATHWMHVCDRFPLFRAIFFFFNFSIFIPPILLPLVSLQFNASCFFFLIYLILVVHVKWN